MKAEIIHARTASREAPAVCALYVQHLAGRWRLVCVVSAIMALYLNVFVAVVQAFLKIRFVNALAPKQSDPPFMIAQLVVLAVFVALAVMAVKSFRPQGRFGI